MEKKQTFVILTILFSLVILHTQAAPHGTRFIITDTAEVKSALQKVNWGYGQAFVKADSSLFLNSYTDDACILPANSPAICGKAGQLTFFRFAYRSGVRNILFKTIGIYGLTNEYVTEQGAYEMFGANNVSLGKGKYLVLWKKGKDGWRMYRDMFNGNSPAK